MKNRASILVAISCLVFAATAFAAGKQGKNQPAASHTPPKATHSVTHGSVTVEGQRIHYTATAGTILMHNKKGQTTGSMFYVAYVKRDGDKSRRPVTFFYNGGPGSSTIWLHMGAFGPRRVKTADHTHTPAGSYRLVNNQYSLLDATDEVFIDAMSTGYSRIIGKKQGGAGTKKDFYGVDPDVKAFAQFIMKYLSKNNRWVSPKYLYGESYGTLRSELLVNYLEQKDDVDVNGVVLQSAYTGGAVFMPDLTYEVDLPTYAAVAWYHHKLPHRPAQLKPFLQKVEHFAMHQYAVALNAGSTLGSAKFNTIAQKLHDYTGLSVAYIKKANLRVSDGEFRHQLLNKKDLTVGDLDARFTGPSMDPLGQRAKYDPQAAAISSAYVAGFNAYAHNVLKYDRGQHYRPEAYDIVHPWPHKHVNLVTHHHMFGLNAGVDLAQAMKYNPDLQVEVDEGLYDLNLPYYGMIYSLHHLRIPKKLRSHIHVKFYRSGHMIYVHVPALKKLHDNTAAFIHHTENR